MMVGDASAVTTNPIEKTSHHDSMPWIEFSSMKGMTELWLTQMRDRVTIDTIRPLPLFLGITGPAFCLSGEAFTPPSKHWDKNTSEKVRQRLRLNFAYFLSNYVLIFLGTTIVVTLTHPIMIMYLGIVWLLWQTHIVMVQHQIPLVILNYDLGEYLTDQRRSLLLYFLTAGVVTFYCLTPFLTVIFVSGFIILTHAIMRDPKHIDQQGSRGHRRTAARGDSDDSDADTDEEVIVDKKDFA